jgi:hypothetical protein
MSSKKPEFCGTTFFRSAKVISGTYDFLCGSTAISETQLSNFSLIKILQAPSKDTNTPTVSR